MEDDIFVHFWTGGEQILLDRGKPYAETVTGHGRAAIDRPPIVGASNHVGCCCSAIKKGPMVFASRR